MLHFLKKDFPFKDYMKHAQWGCVPIVVAYMVALAFQAPLTPWRTRSAKQSLPPLSSLISSPHVSLETTRTSENPSLGAHTKTLVVEQGDTFNRLLTKHGISQDQSAYITKALKTVINPSKLAVGQEIHLSFDTQKDQTFLTGLSFSPEIGIEIQVKPGKNGLFDASKKTYKLYERQVAVGGEIRTNLYQDAINAGIAPKIVASIIRVLGHRFDLQRDLHKGDTFKVLYKSVWDQIRGESKPDNFLFVSVTVGGKTHTFYQFKPQGSKTYAVFDAQGNNLNREFLRTPIDGARLSSTFGRRTHPVLGYTKMHKGVDFAAPIGTPIVAAGDGIVVKASPFSTYGNYIRIRHNNRHETAYAHLKRFASGIRAGASVRQGQVIGYVGMTGRTTGPHLHFELIESGKQINPSRLNRLPSKALTGSDLRSFQQYTQKMTQAYFAQVSQQGAIH